MEKAREKYLERCVRYWKEGKGGRNLFSLTNKEREAIQQRSHAFRGTTLGIFNANINAKNGTYQGATHIRGERTTSITYNPITAQEYAFEALDRLKRDSIQDEPVLLRINMEPYKGRTMRGLEYVTNDEFVILGPLETKDIEQVRIFSPQYLEKLESYLRDSVSLEVYPFNLERVKQDPETHIRIFIENVKKRIALAKSTKGGK